MGGEARIILYAEDNSSASSGARAAFDRMVELESVMTDYREDSEAMEFCRSWGRGPVPVSGDFFAVLRRSREIAEASDGAFDVTIGPVVRLWREAGKRGEVPGNAEIERALELCGWRNLVLDPVGRTAELKQEGMLLDFGGIGKGFAADEALAVLRERGLSHVLVELGGDIALGDPPPDREDEAWLISVNPGWESDGAPPLQLTNCAVATSGDAYRFAEADGQRFSHIIDPRTGMGVTHHASVTVIAADAATADALASALSVLGLEHGFKLLGRFPGTSALMEFRAGGEEHRVWSDGFPMSSSARAEDEKQGFGPAPERGSPYSSKAAEPDASRGGQHP